MARQNDKQRINEHGERVTKRRAQNIRTRLGREAESNCANFGTPACPFAICVVGIQTERIASNTCPYFVKNVLPGNPKLESDYLDALPDDHPMKPKAESVAKGQPEGKRCKTCSVEFEPRSNRQKYCDTCAAQRRKETEAKRKRDKRLDDAIKGE